MPNDLTLFGEPVPLETFGVREALDRELVVNTYRHSSTILYLKRAARWFPSSSRFWKRRVSRGFQIPRRH